MSGSGVRVHVRPRMGSWLGVTIMGPALAREAAVRSAFAVAARLERRLTRFAAASELSQVNRAAGRPVLVSPEVARALRTARRMARLTGGAFDPTAAPLVDLWSAAARDRRRPSEAALAAARRHVGWRKLTIAGRRVRLARGTALDLGGFGKGFAVDRIVRAIRRVPAATALVNFGESSLGVAGAAPSGGWPVVVRGGGRSLAGHLWLHRGACSTSAARPRPEGSNRPTIDPRSGRPVSDRRQVTVLASVAAVAEAASTALLVVGRAGIARLARALTVEVCWIDRTGMTVTPGFPLDPAPGGTRR